MNQAVEFRPRNASATRDAILQAARRRFLRDGYDHVGVRAIAADVGVDPALIPRYFGSKERLFAAVLETTSRDPMEVIAGPREAFGSRVARALLDPGDRAPERMAFIELATRSSASPTARKLVRRHIEQRFMGPFTEWLGGERAAEKAWLTACLLMGVVVMAGVERRPAPDDTEAAIRTLGALLQAVIDDV